MFQEQTDLLPGPKSQSSGAQGPQPSHLAPPASKDFNYEDQLVARPVGRRPQSRRISFRQGPRQFAGEQKLEARGQGGPLPHGQEADQQKPDKTAT